MVESAEDQHSEDHGFGRGINSAVVITHVPPARVFQLLPTRAQVAAVCILPPRDTPDQHKTIYASVYIRPTSQGRQLTPTQRHESLVKTLTNLEEMIESVPGPWELVVGGDFNIPSEIWDLEATASHQTPTRTAETLLEWATRKGLVLVTPPGFRTYAQEGSLKSTIDLTFSTQPIASYLGIWEGANDHIPIYINVKMGAEPE